MEKTIVENTLERYLNEAFRCAQNRKIIIFGSKRIAVFYYCAIRAMGRDVQYFVDPDASPDEDCKRALLGKPVYPVYRLLYEDPSEIAVINSTHSRDEANRLLQSYGLQENVSVFNLHGYQSAKEYDVFDPLTGYARAEDAGCFRMHGQDEEGALRIVALGGATTDYSYSQIKSWPILLHELLLGLGIANVVWNGGLNGYTSCEERDLALRDVPCLNPDLVISLSGECDIGYIMTSKEHPWYSNYSSGKLCSILREHKHKDMRLWFDEVGGDVLHSNTMPDAQHWLNNQRIIYATLKCRGIDYVACLQPIIFEGGYEMSYFEKKCMDRFMTEGAKELPSIQQIFDEGKSFYRKVREGLSEHDFIYDLSGVFNGVSGVYSDGVHYDEEGNRLIAQRILSILCEHNPILQRRLFGQVVP